MMTKGSPGKSPRGWFTTDASPSWWHGHGASGANELTDGLAVEAPTSRKKSELTLFFSTGAILGRGHERQTRCLSSFFFSAEDGAENYGRWRPV